jgi:hypothetical protein
VENTPITCFQGPLYDTTPCVTLDIKGNLASFQAGPLKPYSGVTINAFVNYTPDYKTSYDPEFTGSASGNLGPRANLSLATSQAGSASNSWVNIALISPALIIVSIVLIKIDPRSAVDNYNKWLKPDNVPAVFQPPEKLAPAEMVIALTGSESQLPNLAISGTIFDLASRNWIKITTTTPGNLSSKNTLVLTRMQGKTSLKSWELELLNGLFVNGNVLTLDKPLPNFTPVVSKVANNISSQLKEKNLWSTDLVVKCNKLTKIQYLGFIPMIAGFIISGWALALGILVSILGFGLVTYGFIKKITGFNVYQNFTLSDFYRNCAGFKKLLTTGGSLGRAQLVSRLGLQPSDLVATFFPYAVIFGVEKQWVDSFKNLNISEVESLLNLEKGALSSSTISVYGLTKNLSTINPPPQIYSS